MSAGHTNGTNAAQTPSVARPPGSVPPPSMRPRWVTNAGVGLSVAAALAVGWLLFAPDGPVPAYRVDARGGERTARGAPGHTRPTLTPPVDLKRVPNLVPPSATDYAARKRALAEGRGDHSTNGGGALHDPEVQTLHPDDVFELALQPAASPGGAVSVAPFVARGSEMTAWEVLPIVDGEGTIHLRGRAGDVLALPGGDFTLVFAVGRPGTLPTLEQVAAQRARRGAASEWQLVEHDVRLVW